MTRPPRAAIGKGGNTGGVQYGDPHRTTHEWSLRESRGNSPLGLVGRTGTHPQWFYIQQFGRSSRLSEHVALGSVRRYLPVRPFTTCTFARRS